MTHAYQQCDICGYKEFYLGISSSSLTAYSRAICLICANMNADEKWIIDATIECVGGKDKMIKGYCYFDKTDDVYRDSHTDGIIPIELKDGTQFKTRSEFMEYYNANKNT